MGGDEFKWVKCGELMVKGFAGDKGDSQMLFTMDWVDGEPVHAKLLGITGDNVTADRSQLRTVRGLRCLKCGYLELYAV